MTTLMMFLDYDDMSGYDYYTWSVIRPMYLQLSENQLDHVRNCICTF